MIKVIALVKLLLLATIVGFILHAHTLVPVAQAIPDVIPLDLQRAAIASAEDFLGGIPERRLLVSDVKIEGIWAFGYIVIRAPEAQHGGPDLLIFMARQDIDGWNVANEYSSQFTTWLQNDLATHFMTVKSRELLISRNLGSTATTRGDASAQLGFPWAIGETQAYTGGPHANDGITSNPWSSLDFAGGSGIARAARDGVARFVSGCANFVRIDHADGWQTGYYHLINIQVSDGQSVTRGQAIGQHSTQAGCGGSAAGNHVHFSLRRFEQKIDWNNYAIGGWTASTSPSHYNGPLIRNSDGYRLDPWYDGRSTVYNDGQVGNGGISLAPFYNNLVQNAGFDSGFNSWGTEYNAQWVIHQSNGQFSANSYLGFYGLSSQPIGVIRQQINYGANAGDILELKVDLGNPTSSPKQLRVHLHSMGTWDDMLVCDFQVPAGTNRLEHYTIRRKLTTNWSSMRVWIEVRPSDSQPDVWLDAVNVRRLPSNALALTGTECHAPTSGTDWDFTGTNGPQGWGSVGNQFSELSQQANGIRFKVTGDDAWLEGPTMTNVNAASYKYFNVEMATTSNTCGQVLFQPRGNIWFSGTHTVDFVPVTDGTTRVYSINMQSNPNWTGAISQFRFDPNCNSGFNGSAGNYVTIKRIWLSNTIPNPPTVTLSGSPSATEGGTLNYTVNVSPTSNSAITVNFTTSGTAASGIDYTDTGSVVIPANASTAPLAINSIDDTGDEPNESVIVTLTAASGGGAVLGSPIAATGTIIDNDNPSSIVTISGTPSVDEGGVLNYALNVNPISSSVITVNFTTTGTATSGSDYTSINSFVIPANSSTATLAINTTDDSIDEENETVAVELTIVSGGTSVLGTAKTATGTILDNDAPTSLVTISGTPSVTEGGTLNFTLSVSPVSLSAITVNFTITGTATSGSDYAATSYTVVPASAASATLTIDTIDDASVETPESVIVELTTVSGGIAAADTPKTTNGTILDNDSDTTSAVTLTSTPSVTEGGILTFTVSVNPISASEITANFSFSGTATQNSDYTTTTSLVIPANTSSALFSIFTADDVVNESDETVTATLTSVTATAIVGSPNTATGTIVDNDSPPPSIVTLSGAPAAAEGGVLTFDLIVNPVSATPLTVNLWVGGSAASGLDYIPVLNPITIPANTVNHPFSITLLADATTEGDETVVIALLNVSGGGSIGSPNNAIGTIIDSSSHPELLENGGFDNKPATQWIIQPRVDTLLNDKVKCDKAGLPPVSESSPCVFMFRGNTGEGTVLRQILKFPLGAFQTGDALLFKYRFAATGQPSAIAKVTVTFLGGGKQNITPTIKEFGATSGVYVSRESAETILINPNVTKIVVKFINRSLSGKLYIDSVSLVHVKAAESTLPVPEIR